ncbi:hypothetical protein CHARACLAT_033316 [Characodon lateralis]|uniref:Uncharacterized protein n=1 Tax=Characodon lateralis TaxID=208331 RepID=A0ABU7DQM0_9TELE|nr:hypothetical protein [Characodon lateralis]
MVKRLNLGHLFPVRSLKALYTLEPHSPNQTHKRTHIYTPMHRLVGNFAQGHIDMWQKEAGIKPTFFWIARRLLLPLSHSRLFFPDRFLVCFQKRTQILQY